MALSSFVRTSMFVVCLTGSTIPGWAAPGDTPIADSVKRLVRESTPKYDRAEEKAQQTRRSAAHGAIKGAVIGGLIGFAVGVLVAEVAAHDSGEPNFVLVLPPLIGFGVAGGYLGYRWSK
ncbi:MAG: hypothetical protein AB7P34_01505 [Vicinamibacterales bacterium]